MFAFNDAIYIWQISSPSLFFSNIPDLYFLNYYSITRNSVLQIIVLMLFRNCVLLDGNIFLEQNELSVLKFLNRPLKNSPFSTSPVANGCVIISRVAL